MCHVRCEMVSPPPPFFPTVKYLVFNAWIGGEGGGGGEERGDGVQGAWKSQLK